MRDKSGENSTWPEKSGGEKRDSYSISSDSHTAATGYSLQPLPAQSGELSLHCQGNRERGCRVTVNQSSVSTVVQERASSSVRGTQSPLSGEQRERLPSHCQSELSLHCLAGESELISQENSVSTVRGTEREVRLELWTSSHIGPLDPRLRQRYILHLLTATSCSRSTPTTSTRRSTRQTTTSCSKDKSTTSTRRPTSTEGEVGRRVLYSHQESGHLDSSSYRVTPSSLAGHVFGEQESVDKKVRRSDRGEMESGL